jgi:hypothetical protein
MLLERDVLFIGTQFSNFYTSQAPLQALLLPGSDGGAVGPSTKVAGMDSVSRRR